MTIAFRKGEDWTVADGAPDGVGFDQVIFSASEPGKEYRIARQESGPGLEGYIVHTPACTAWRTGHRRCWHVMRALENAEDPLRRFAIDVVEAWAVACLGPDDKIREFAGAIVQSAQQAINAADALDRYEDRCSDPRATIDEAVEAFDRGDPREWSRMGSAMRAMNRRTR